MSHGNICQGHVEGNAYVNKYRLGYYQEVFANVFGKDNVEMRTNISESYRKYLTPELRSRLESFSEEELLTSSPVLVARKQS